MCWPALREVEYADIGTDEVGADKGQDDRNCQHEEEQHESTEAGEGEDLALPDGCIGGAEAFAVLLNVVAVDIESLADLIDTILGCPTLPLGADVGSISHAKHMKGA